MDMMSDEDMKKLSEMIRASIATGPERVLQSFSFQFIGGYCPVQAEGTINGKPWYYRFRHGEWHIEVDEVTIVEGEDDGDGWEPLHQATALIVKELLTWAEKNAPPVPA